MKESNTRRLTMAQALIKYLQAQYVERDGMEQPFFAGCFGIFGHGIVGGHVPVAAGVGFAHAGQGGLKGEPVEQGGQAVMARRQRNFRRIPVHAN